MSQFPANAVFVIVSMPLLVAFAVILSFCAVGLLVSIVIETIWLLREARQTEPEKDILTDNSDLSQESTVRVRAVK